MTESTGAISLTPAERWRLLLGEAAQPSLQSALPATGGSVMAMDQALTWLYGRDGGALGTDALGRHGGSEASRLSVPEWINRIHELFPKETIERLERDAIERYAIDEVVTNLEVLERVEPNPTLLAAVMRTKHLMNPAVLAMARTLVAKVVGELIEKLARDIERSFSGRRHRQSLSRHGAANQFAARETVRRNLTHYDPQRRQLIVRQPLFFSQTRKRLQPWQIFLLVDQSGSMVGSVIHAAVTAACLWNLPGVRTHLITFDTQIVDLSDEVHDPVATLMQVQLGGGTDIGQAIAYAAQNIDVPKRAIVVAISDFFEGANPQVLLDQVASLLGQGTQVLGLAALDEVARPVFDRELASRLADLGAHVGAMTPGQLAGWLAEKLR
ncbi:MAG TPA: VWA domain-containing protein [Accumulibacter sp.]|uniref:VWA domain-containing protein n=1 Tax=Accumulibacter sp. TaxID=2053492 RepID=UPI00287B1B34|nr:VWA domain-containing protein [Accumulibacter sp.]HNN45962.1 VWA domain-containing protein [Azospira sp.]MDS4074362.1 VWA domain-containing protein [Accumulibacter sp.]HMW19064.1 VWA domain-containing protein [Accumulibacter sp.]HNC18971.1 VWA domain-containing protein [Accumulibacter sp.]HNK04515.1 VWA domain-containing protein [Accumulibacter sp.]